MISKSIAVVGSTTIDKIVKDNCSRYKIGGVTTYSGITYRRHGIKTYIVSNVAAGDLMILKKLEREKVNVNHGPTENTTRFINQTGPEGRRQQLLSKAASLKGRQISELADRVSWFHLGPLHSLDIGPSCLKAIRKSKLPVFLDVQGYTRRVHAKKVYAGVSKYLSDALAISHTAKASGAELEAILDYYKMGLTELKTAFNIGEFVVTLGAKGGFVKDKADNEIHYDAVSAEAVEDLTGAGDVFFAAYIYTRVFMGKTIADACRHAAALASRQLSGNFITNATLAL
jgi:sugar/nucleoside kinase (ribokinase family)